MLEYKNEGVLLVISGPSGAGKGTLCKALKEKINYGLSISATTRKPRAGETDGVNYYFLSRAAFEEKLRENGFIEWAEVYGNYYGTPKAPVEKMLKEGKDVVLEIDPQGAMSVRAQMPDAVLIFVMPPSYVELESRIRGRGTETEGQITKRLSCAVSEINRLPSYDYIVVNDDVSTAVNDLIAIISAEKCRVTRNRNLPNRFISDKENE